MTTPVSCTVGGVLTAGAFDPFAWVDWPYEVEGAVGGHMRCFASSGREAPWQYPVYESSDPAAVAVVRTGPASRGTRFVGPGRATVRGAREDGTKASVSFQVQRRPVRGLRSLEREGEAELTAKLFELTCTISGARRRLSGR